MFQSNLLVRFRNVVNFSKSNSCSVKSEVFNSGFPRKMVLICRYLMQSRIMCAPVSMTTETLRVILYTNIIEIFIDTTMVCDDLNSSLDVWSVKFKKFLAKVFGRGFAEQFRVPCSIIVFPDIFVLFRQPFIYDTFPGGF